MFSNAGLHSVKSYYYVAVGIFLPHSIIDNELYSKIVVFAYLRKEEWSTAK